jgi:hypothetical protein
MDREQSFVIISPSEGAGAESAPRHASGVDVPTSSGQGAVDRSEDSDNGIFERPHSKVTGNLCASAASDQPVQLSTAVSTACRDAHAPCASLCSPVTDAIAPFVKGTRSLGEDSCRRQGRLGAVWDPGNFDEGPGPPVSVAPDEVKEVRELLQSMYMDGHASANTNPPFLLSTEYTVPSEDISMPHTAPAERAESIDVKAGRKKECESSIHIRAQGLRSMCCSNIDECWCVLHCV